jgi:uncharacterized protein (TIGR03000 family)
LVVTLPVDAKLFVNDRLMKSRGATRRFASPELKPGRTYPYALRAEWTRDGEPVVREQIVYLRAGERESLVINETSPQTTTTTLTVHVPNDATVTLAGVETESTGTVREFSTAKLAPGQRWENYRIEVTVERDGQETTQQRELVLVGGEAQETSFDFNTTQVALND